MVKVLNTSSNNNLFFNSEQYNDCSSFLMKADDPPLEELDPAILSCGLPAIVLSDMPLRAPKIRYTPGQLQAMRKSALCFRRPVVADDPRIGQFAIWKTASQLKRGCRPYTARPDQKNDRGDDMGPHVKDAKAQEKPPGAMMGHQKFHHGGRENNGFVGPRFRRNFDFSSRNHHVIVKSYRGDEHYRLQDTVIEEEPEWMSAGPTSRLDTIELRGFDEDVSPNVSLEKANAGTSTDGQKHPSGKHISFYDDLHHYEHIVHQKRGNTSSGDVESVATSNSSSPPPARSTPTKGGGDLNNNLDDEKAADGQQKLPPNGVDVNNFEEFMKFDSILGTDSNTSGSSQSGSRSSKWFRRSGSGFNQSTGWNYDGRRQSYSANGDFLCNSRFPYQNQQQRNFGPSTSYGGRSGGFHPTETFDHPSQFTDESAFKRLCDMLAENRARANNNLFAQQQYLMQLLSKNQQSEILRRMLMKNAVDNVSESNQQQQQQSPGGQPRIPTQQELQFHTQSIMQNALLRKKLQDQRRMLFEQNNHQMTAAAASAAEANPAVQQFVQSVCPNIQRSLSVLSQTAANQQFPTPSQFPSHGSGPNSMFPGGSTSVELSNSLQQMLLSQPSQQQQQQQGQRPAGSGRRLGKGSVTWNLN